jgi:uncharacterized protein
LFLFLQSEKNCKYVVPKLKMSLLQACKENNYVGVKVLTMAYRDTINDVCDDGLAPIHYAVWNESEVNVERLVNKGADLSKGDRDGVTPIMYATEGPVPLFNQLLFAYDDGGWEINQKDNDGWTAVNHAIRKGTIEHLEALNYYCADLDIPQNDGLTPLMISIIDGYIDKAKWLLRHGADPNLVDNAGNTALHYACVYHENDMYLLSLLLESGACVNVVNYKGQPPIVFCDTLSAALALHINKAYLNCVYEGGRTYLQDAREEGNTALVNFLENHGATVI